MRHVHNEHTYIDRYIEYLRTPNAKTIKNKMSIIMNTEKKTESTGCTHSQSDRRRKKKKRSRAYLWVHLDKYRKMERRKKKFKQNLPNHARRKYMQHACMHEDCHHCARRNEKIIVNKTKRRPHSLFTRLKVADLLCGSPSNEKERAREIRI